MKESNVPGGPYVFLPVLAALPAYWALNLLRPEIQHRSALGYQVKRVRLTAVRIFAEIPEALSSFCHHGRLRGERHGRGGKNKRSRQRCAPDGAVGVQTKQAGFMPCRAADPNHTKP